MRYKLFSGGDLQKVLWALPEQATTCVRQLAEDLFRGSNEQQVYDYVRARVGLTPITLNRKKEEREIHDSRVLVSSLDRFQGDGGQRTVPGYRLHLRVPFEGSHDLWKYQPNAWQGDPPSAEVDIEKKILHFYVEAPKLDTATEEYDYQSMVVDSAFEAIETRIQSQRQMIEDAEPEFDAAIRKAIADRRSDLAKRDKLKEMWNIPLNRATGSESMLPLPVKRTAVRPLVADKCSEPEWGLPDAEFEHILKVIRHMGATFEQTPTTAAKLGEEDYRNLLLATLRSHYDGGASGETFRGGGKTDILVPWKDRDAFIAELKLWGGDQAAKDALDQLLGYTTWRDCKVALVFFSNEIKDFQRLQGRIPDIFDGHPNCLSSIPYQPAGEWRFKVKSSTDPDRELTVHVFLFDLFRGAEGQEACATMNGTLEIEA